MIWKIKIDTNNVPIDIPTIQKSVPKSAGTTSTKNNITGGNEKEKSSSSGMISTTGKKSFIDLIGLDGKINNKKTIYNRKSNIGPAGPFFFLFFLVLHCKFT